MTEIIRSEGIVLKRRDFGETSRLAVTYTLAAGKVQLLAKGARNTKNKFGAVLEPLTRGEFVFYWRENKDLFTLTEAATLASARRIREDPLALPFGLAMAEAVDRLSAEGDADSGVFNVLASALDALDAGGPPKLLLTQLLFRLAKALGLRPTSPHARNAAARGRTRVLSSCGGKGTRFASRANPGPKTRYRSGRPASALSRP